MQQGVRQIYIVIALIFIFLIGAQYDKYLNTKELENAKALYDKGKYASAVEAFKGLAEMGDAEARFYLADMFYGGEGIQQDYVQAASWYQRAAEQGHINAQFNLASLYLIGKGVKQSFVEASKWYRRAADQGDAEAQTNLAVMYFKGEGVKQDRVQAYRWLVIAGMQGFRRAEEYRQIVAQRLTNEQIAEGQRLSQGWKPQTRIKP